MSFSSIRRLRQNRNYLNNSTKSDPKVRQKILWCLHNQFAVATPIKYTIISTVAGTLVVVYNLRLMDNGEPELDVS